MPGGYNGWRNRATWCIALWYSNDEGLMDYINETIQEFAEDGMTKGEARGELMGVIESDVNRMYDDCFDAVEHVGGGFATDLLLTSPDWLDIDYYHIADSMLEDYDEIRSESLRGSAKAAYGKTKAVTQKGVQKTKAAAGKAKTKVAPKKAPAKSASNRAKAPAKKAPAKKSAPRRR